MDIQNLLKTKRQEKNMTMEDLGKLLGVSAGTISRWESGNIQNIKVDKIPLISKYLDIPMDLFLSEDSVNNLNKKVKKMEESVKYLNKTSFNNCNFQDSIGELTIQTADPSPAISDIINNAKQMTKEGQEKVLEYTELLLGKYKK